MLISALLIFTLRVIDISFYTMRIMMVVQGRRRLAWIFAFCQSMIYVNAILILLAKLDNWLNIIGYAAGFATGNVVGLWLENRLNLGCVNLTIVSTGFGTEIAERLRAEGYAVTEIAARGRDGMVSMLECSIRRKDMIQLKEFVRQIDPQAFITSEKVRPIEHGFWHK